MLIIIEEFKRYKQYLFDQSSLKEQMFFRFLVKETLDYPSKEDLTDMEQICLSSFCNDAPSQKKLIDRKRKEKVIGGMHYTNNLIELTAMAIDDIKQEEENLKSYCQNNPIKHYYILNQLFPDLSLYRADPHGSIDQIALHLCKKDFPKEGWKPLLLNALYETSDLIDFYVVEQGYQQAMDDHPVVHEVNNIDIVRNDCQKFVEKTERNVKWIIRIIIIFLVVSISYWLVPFILRNWDDVEPIIAIIDFLRDPEGIVLSGCLGYFPGKIKLLNSLNEKAIDWIFKRKGFNRSELKKSLVKLSRKCKY